VLALVKWTDREIPKLTPEEIAKKFEPPETVKRLSKGCLIGEYDHYLTVEGDDRDIRRYLRKFWAHGEVTMMVISDCEDCPVNKFYK